MACCRGDFFESLFWTITNILIAFFKTVGGNAGTVDSLKYSGVSRY